MTHLQRFNLAHNPDFQGRVTVCAVRAAVAVAAEDPATANHAARKVIAGKVLADPIEWGRKVAIAVAQSSGITEAASDSDVEFTVNSVWNALSLAP